MNLPSPAKQGFTLIELSIVLVIIGLIIGGILVGQDLIRAGQLHSQIKQIQLYQSAFNTFIGKYNCIPGDCANATTFFGTTDAGGNTISNGNGNGVIDDGAGATFMNNAFQSFSVSPEMGGAFQELAAAKMINFIPSDPTSYLIGVSRTRQWP